MSLKDGAEQIFKVVDLEDGEPDFFACVALQVQVGNGYLLHSRNAADRDLDDVLGSALSGGYFRPVEGKR